MEQFFIGASGYRRDGSYLGQVLRASGSTFIIQISGVKRVNRARTVRAAIQVLRYAGAAEICLRYRWPEDHASGEKDNP